VELPSFFPGRTGSGDLRKTAVEQQKLALSVEEAAKVSGVGRTMLFAEIRKGRITARKVGRRTIIMVDDLDAWLKALPKRTDKSAT
jgi:excisionase family DNA binding protein